MALNINSTDEINRYGFTQVRNHSVSEKCVQDSIVDIVLIHGLNGHPRRTWEAIDGTFWPTDLLPPALKGFNARILVYGYDANSSAFGFGAINGTTFDMLTKQAQKFVSNLAELRELDKSNGPIIFVAHDFGGLIIKRALILSYDAPSTDMTRSIYISTYGIMFFGTPHVEADPRKWDKISNRIMGDLILETEIKNTKINTETAQNVNLRFMEIVQLFEICAVRETTEMEVEETAEPIYSLPNVVNYICKFDGKTSPAFFDILGEMASWVNECLPRIELRKQMERAQNPADQVKGKLKKHHQALKLQGHPLLNSTQFGGIHSNERGSSKGRSKIDPNNHMQFPNEPPQETNIATSSQSHSPTNRTSPRTVLEVINILKAGSLVIPLYEKSPQETGPSILQEYITIGDIRSVVKLLENKFNQVAQQDFEWLHELLNIGSSYGEIANLLIAGDSGSPWILQVFDSSQRQFPKSGFHQINCVHKGGLSVDVTPQLRPRNLSGLVQEINTAKTRNSVYHGCGLAGILPPVVNSNTVELSNISFTGKRNSIVSIHYSSNRRILRQTMIDVLERCLSVIHLLQTAGACCDNFSVLGLSQSLDDMDLELCRLDISLIEDLVKALQEGVDQIPSYHERSFDLARYILKLILGDKVSFASSASYGLNLCAMATQVLSIGLLSYSQGHIGKLHPEYLVDPLEEIHLLGRSSNGSSEHIMAELVNLTCLGNMLENPVLVFRFANNSTQSLDKKLKHNLWATPEDLADIWGPTRFVASTMDPHSLFAIEIGGGTIMRVDEDPWKLHWKIGASPYEDCKPFSSTDKMLIAGARINEKCPLSEDKSWKHPVTNAFLRHLGTSSHSWDLQATQVGLSGGQYAVLQFNATYIKQNGVTLKQQQLMLPFNEIDLAFLNSTCGLQISLCTGVARRVSLRQLLADVMVPFIESRLLKPEHWEELKTEFEIVERFRGDDIEKWFNRLPLPLQETTIQIVRNMLEVLKNTGIDKSGEELVIAWVRKESPYSCFRLRCEKTSLWARILADSEECATFACVTPLCLEIENHKCRNVEEAPWHNASNMLDTAVYQHLSNRDITAISAALVPWQLQHQVSYWIGKSGTNMIAKVWLINDAAEPRLLVRQKIIPEKYRSRMPRIMVERLGRLRERQASDAIAKQVVILTEI